MLVVSAPCAEELVRRVCLARISLLWVSPVKTLLVGSSLDNSPGMRGLLVLKR